MAVSFHFSIFKISSAWSLARGTWFSHTEEFLMWSSPHQQSLHAAQGSMSPAWNLGLYAPSQHIQAQPASLACPAMLV